MNLALTAEGDDDWDVEPYACIYAFLGNHGAATLEKAVLGVAVSKTDAAPMLYAAIGKHRVMEYIDGKLVTGTRMFRLVEQMHRTVQSYWIL